MANCRNSKDLRDAEKIALFIRFYRRREDTLVIPHQYISDIRNKLLTVLKSESLQQIS